MMQILETDSDDDALVLDEADRLRSLVLGKYSKILGSEYKENILKKLDYIVLEFKKRTYEEWCV